MRSSLSRAGRRMQMQTQTPRQVHPYVLHAPNTANVDVAPDDAAVADGRRRCTVAHGLQPGRVQRTHGFVLTPQLRPSSPRVGVTSAIPPSTLVRTPPSFVAAEDPPSRSHLRSASPSTPLTASIHTFSWTPVPVPLLKSCSRSAWGALRYRVRSQLVHIADTLTTLLPVA
ncbi:hypothetical protein B0H12DRAFT_1238713 [Mycena haematopus]|nr:hypothetical protein B0H12DRAFT_1238713 [Mycena haematopus]